MFSPKNTHTHTHAEKRNEFSRKLLDAHNNMILRICFEDTCAKMQYNNNILMLISKAIIRKKRKIYVNLRFYIYFICTDLISHKIIKY